MKEFDEMVEVMARLRKECPWDRKQSLQTLRTYLLEEAYETLSAMNSVETEGFQNLLEELGDLQLQILFQAEILKELGVSASLQKILGGLKEKLVRRHPHIFGEKKGTETAEQVLAQWTEIKKAEKLAAGKSSHASLLDGIAKNLTALQKAQKFGDRSKEVRFDWENADQVWKHFESEVIELKEARNPSEREHEFGDILFCLVQWARHQKIDAEVALASANDRFQKRFEKMEDQAHKNAQDFAGLSLDEKEKLWLKAKAELRNK